MRSPAFAIAWEFRQRHRWGLIAVMGYLLVIATIRFLVLQPGQPLNWDDVHFALVLIVPLSATFTYFLAVFSFGFAGDLAGRESMYPARLFTLPMTTAALVGWPMLYGSAAMAILWLATRLFGVWPPDVAVPVIWPALLAAAFLGWTQALTWMPYPLPGFRVIAAFLWLAVLDTVVMLALHFKASELTMVALIAPQLPLAYLAAHFAVARGRRGDVPDWRGMFGRLGQIAEALPRRRRRFPAPAGAQAWFEWRQHGRTLPGWVAILLPFELALLFAAGNDNPSLVWYTLFGVLLTPPFMAAFAATTVRKSDPRVRDSYHMTPFSATRPLTSAALVAAKLRTTIWSTLAAWLLVVVAIPLALTLSGTWPVVIERARQMVEAVGTARAVVIVLLGFWLLLASTWKQLVQSLYIGLSGRGWLIKSSVFLTVSIFIFVEPIIQWLSAHGAARAALWNAVPLIAAVLVCFKMSAAVWVATRLLRSRVLSDRTLVIGAACWLVVVLALHGLLVWFFSTPLFPRYLLALIAILAIPLARLSAAPLALAWNRHR